MVNPNLGPMVDFAACCSAVLAGLDEDLLALLARDLGSACGADGKLTIEKKDLTELVVPMLLDAEVAADEETASALVDTLWARLNGGTEGGAGGEVTATAEAAREEVALRENQSKRKLDSDEVAPPACA